MAEAGNLDDRSLVEEFKRSGDQACIAALFQRYARRLYALAHGIEHDHANAEDCVQETFRRVIQEIGRFDEAREGSNVWAWLVTIAEHVCFDELRRERAREAFAQKGGAGKSSRRVFSQEQQCMVSELRRELLTLAPEHRICCLLHVEGYKYQEIAKLTGFTKEQVKTYIQTARRHLHRRFRLSDVFP
jgi:RNA polymerase sigma-70 factor (ECF subfamily)